MAPPWSIVRASGQSRVCRVHTWSIVRASGQSRVGRVHTWHPAGYFYPIYLFCANSALCPLTSQDWETASRSCSGDQYTVQRSSPRHNLHPGTAHLRQRDPICSTAGSYHLRLPGASPPNPFQAHKEATCTPGLTHLCSPTAT